jgi:hypothetical protein
MAGSNVKGSGCSRQNNQPPKGIEGSRLVVISVTILVNSTSVD